MKKSSILILFSVFLMFVLSGCGKKETRDFHMENHAWTFSEVVGSENPVSDLECSAVDETLTIQSANGDKWELTYKISGKDTNSLIYELEYVNGTEAVKGMAVSSITEYAKGKYEYTLVIDLDGYAIYFYDRESEE